MLALESRDAFDHPIARDAADGVGRNPPQPMQRAAQEVRCPIQRPMAMTANTAAMNINWPISTPTLKNSSATGTDELRQAHFGQCAREARAHAAGRT